MNPSPNSTPTRAEIEDRARTLWLAHGSPAGRDLDIWLEAERQLVAERTMADAPGSRRAPRRGERSLAADEIDETELVERMDSVVDTNRRSATSINLTD